ncbi:response regulator [Roseateles sp. GG27B]
MTSKILVIEDQADIRRLIRWSLEDTGHSLHEAPNGTQGLDLALSLRPDLVFLDVMMPGGLGGIEVCAKMRAEPALAHTVIVMLTADAAQQTRNRALEAGANYFLAKPFSPAKLLELTESLLASPTEPEADAEAP